MVGTAVPHASVVVGVDGSAAAALALDWAAAQAAIEGRALVVAHAILPQAAAWVDPDGRETRIGLSGRRAGEVRILDEAREQIEQRTRDLDVHEVLRVAEARTLLNELGEDAAMVVVGSRGLGPARSFVLGSVGRSLTRHPPCPVVVHRPRPHEATSSEVVVGVDGSPRSLPVVEFAFRIAGQRDLSVRLLHTYGDTPTVAHGMWAEPRPGTALATEQEIAPQVEVLIDRYPGVPVITEVLRGPPEAMLPAASEHRAMVVLGAHHPGLSGLLPSSVTMSVLEHARCPIAVVPVGE